MKLTDVLPPENVVADAPGGSKKRVLENLSSFLSERMDTVTADELYQGLLYIIFQLPQLPRLIFESTPHVLQGNSKSLHFQ